LQDSGSVITRRTWFGPSSEHLWGWREEGWVAKVWLVMSLWVESKSLEASFLMSKPEGAHVWISHLLWERDWSREHGNFFMGERERQHSCNQ
jgi:hypothetical protein